MFIKDGEKILILTGRFGEGHQQAANAIQEAAMAEFPNTETVIVDFMADAYPNLYPVSHYVYMKGIKKFPQLYGFIFKKTYEKNYFSQKLTSLFSLGIGKMLKILQEVRPTVVVSTYPFASSVFSKLKEYGLTNVPLVTVITDYTCHSSWVHPYTDQYIVGSHKIGEKLIRYGIPNDRIACTGIPIRKRFLEKRDRNELIHKYKLERNIPTILIMGGGDGLIGKGFLNNHTLEMISERLQLIILCGNNHKLRQQLENDLSCSKHRIEILGYTDKVNELMAVANIIITKPGGITISEALAMELPMLLYKPLPGQERDNAKYLINASVAVQADNPSDLVLQLSTMLKNEVLLARMKKKTRHIQMKRAAFSALEIINHSIANPVLFIREDIPSTKFKSLKHITSSILTNQGQ